MARPSIILSFEDRDFEATFTELWNEHVDGFGHRKKPKSAATKKVMEWRRRLDAKKKTGGDPADGFASSNKGGALLAGLKRRRRGKSGDAAPDASAVSAKRKKRASAGDVSRTQAVEAYRRMKQVRGGRGVAGGSGEGGGSTKGPQLSKKWKSFGRR